mmetsp:Transcript_118541/g.377877  ORF Transcript_118541/g.377877 Transcript_118541/m.377877 type:complete len:201 (+) Transcript_118541:1595-2197(+)
MLRERRASGSDLGATAAERCVLAQTGELQTRGVECAGHKSQAGRRLGDRAVGVSSIYGGIAAVDHRELRQRQASGAVGPRHVRPAARGGAGTDVEPERRRLHWPWQEASFGAAKSTPGSVAARRAVGFAGAAHAVAARLARGFGRPSAFSRESHSSAAVVPVGAQAWLEGQLRDPEGASHRGDRSSARVRGRAWRALLNA